MDQVNENNLNVELVIEPLSNKLITKFGQKLIHTTFSADGKYFATGSNDNTVNLIDIKQLKLIHRFNHQEYIESLTFSPNGQYLVIGYSGNINIFDVKQLKVFKQIFKDNFESTTLINIKGLKISHPSNQISRVDFSQDWLISCNSTLQQNSDFDLHQKFKKKITTIKFQPNGQYLATGSYDYTVKLISIKSRQLTHNFTFIHKSFVFCVAFSPNGQYLATGSQDTTVNLIDVQSKKIIHKFDQMQSGVISLAFSPDGQYLATGSQYSTVRLINTSLYI